MPFTEIPGGTLQLDRVLPSRAGSCDFTKCSVQRKLSATFSAALIAVVLLPDGARAQSCPLNVPHVNGTWTILPYQMPINPISATLLPGGKVLIVAGSENDASNNSKGSESYRAPCGIPPALPRAASAFRN